MSQHDDDLPPLPDDFDVDTAIEEINGNAQWWKTYFESTHEITAFQSAVASGLHPAQLIEILASNDENTLRWWMLAVLMPDLTPAS